MLRDLQSFYARLDHHSRLIQSGQQITLTPSGVVEALKVVTEFCDKGKLGFLTGDLSIELYEVLLNHLSYLETKRNEDNSEIYKKVEEFLVKEDFALPKHGIQHSELENQQALFIRQLCVEKDSAQITLSKDRADTSLLTHSAFGLNYMTPKEQLIKVFLPFCRLLRAEQEHCLRKDLSQSRRKYSPMLLACSADKIALVCLNVLLKLSIPHLKEDSEVIEIPFSNLVVQIGLEVQKQIKNDKQDRLFEDFKNKRKEQKLYPITDEKYLRKLLSNELKTVTSRFTFSAEIRAETGALVFRLLSQAVSTPDKDKPMLKHDVLRTDTNKSKGVVKVSRELARILLGKNYDQKKDMVRFILERTLPMICKPAKWVDSETGGYLQQNFSIMRTQGSRLQKAALERADISKVCEVLNIMGDTPWRINRKVHEVAERLYELGGGVGEIPVVDDGHQFIPDEKLSFIEKKRLEKQKRDNWSLLSDFEIKLGIARNFSKLDRFYMPLNVDFRGRIYPISPHLNQIGNDISRGLLEFARGKPLGPAGFRWLKIHLANKMGHDKLPINERIAIVETNMEMFKDISKDPVKNREWLALEDPWQSLASIYDLIAAIESPDPEKYVSRLHVHQDGSCNGLQHYAALGRDIEGAEQVNLADAERPGDIYTAVSKKVQERVNKDAAEGHRIAVQLVEKIKRKVVKQTVMTSVYGVTFIGAKDQIMRQLSDRGILPEEDLKAGALYLATITMSAIADLFAGAHRIKEWFIKCAGSIAKAGYPVSWVTPLGLPVVQPYRRGNQTMFIDTFFQRVSLLSNKDNLPISVPKQKSAFPPNYVHSLDSTHLMLTAIECHKYDIMFAAVHDSFWTHACDIDLMNKLLREKFVYLHSQPLLENLLADFKARHPSIHFDPVPQLGNFDLNKVLTSTYFFA
jgi:DNA-directed RNA polymerase